MTQNNRVYKTGLYELKNPQKYTGQKPPVYKSSFEGRVFYWCDMNSKVLEWAYEDNTIPYTFSVPDSAPEHEKSLVDFNVHKYTPDVTAKIKTTDGKIVTYLIEIKPYSQTIKPIEPKRKTKKALNKFMKALQEYLKNACKWEAAKIWVGNHGMEFTVITERDIFT